MREAAVDAIGRHPELEDTARAVLAEALGAPEPGLVATAAGLIASHPEYARAPAPSGGGRASGQGVVDPRVGGALRSAVARPWGADLVETRAALLDAVMAAGLDEDRGYVEDACDDANATLRARAEKALAAAGARCPGRVGRAGSGAARERRAGAPAPELGHAIARPTRVVFETEVGALAVTFDPALAPIAATRFVALARSGFYTQVVVHRVVPGFVVQFGDRGGDGYGGAGGSLRCETSPVPFGPLDVGVALAGRDTGSSQLFVTLARHPNLDGRYAWVGHADGDWNAVAEGDTVQRVRVEE